MDYVTLKKKCNADTRRQNVFEKPFTDQKKKCLNKDGDTIYGDLKVTWHHHIITWYHIHHQKGHDGYKTARLLEDTGFAVWSKL